MEKIHYTVDTDEYYQGFVKSTSMKPCDALKELQQNIKRDKMNTIDFNISLLDNSENKCKLFEDKKNHVNSHLDVKYIVVDDNSKASMTKDNAVNMMKSLMKTNKKDGIGCFNFGEILSGSILTNGEGVVLYFNKNTSENWILKFENNKCPVLEFTIPDDYTFLMNNIYKYVNDNDNGTLKIFIPEETYDFVYKPIIYDKVSDYINISINDELYEKFILNPEIESLFNNREYNYQCDLRYYIDYVDQSAINFIKKQNREYYYVDNVKKTTKVSGSKTYSKIDKVKGKEKIKKSNFEIRIRTIILPYEIYDKTKTENKIICNFSGFNLTIKKLDEINKLIYPNPGNHALQHTFTFIEIKCLRHNQENENGWIKKNILNFYPDKLKTGDPILDWKYIHNYIKYDLELYYSHVSSDKLSGYKNMFAVREKNVPSMNNNIYEFIPSGKDEEGNRIDSKYEEKKNPFDNKANEESSDDSEEEIDDNDSNIDKKDNPRIELDNLRDNIILDFTAIVKSSNKVKLNNIRSLIDKL
jgi:hypothetical protein